MVAINLSYSSIIKEKRCWQSEVFYYTLLGTCFFFYVESWLFKHNKKPIEIVRYDKIVVFMRRKADLNVTKSIYLKIIMVLFLKDRKKNIRKRNIGLLFHN